MIELILLTVAGIIVLLGLVFVWKLKKNNWHHQADYRTLFIMGVIFLPFGAVMMITTENPGMIGISGLGAAYIAAGLANRDKWDKKQPFSSEQRKWMVISVVIGIIALVACSTAFIMFL